MAMLESLSSLDREHKFQGLLMEILKTVILCEPE